MKPLDRILVKDDLIKAYDLSGQLRVYQIIKTAGNIAYTDFQTTLGFFNMFEMHLGGQWNDKVFLEEDEDIHTIPLGTEVLVWLYCKEPYRAIVTKHEWGIPNNTPVYLCRNADHHPTSVYTSTSLRCLTLPVE